MTARRVIVLGVVALHLGAAYVGWTWFRQTHRPAGRPTVLLPALSEQAVVGARLFDLHCAACHGRDAGGTAVGPTLIHTTYRPAHHADVSFTLAVRHGVPAHHWNFGNMPPVPAVKADEVTAIVRFVREVQKANGVQ